MSLVYPDPALPSNPNPYFTDNSFARGDQQRANNGFIWANLEDLDARLINLNPTTDEGDLIVRGATELERLPVGAEVGMVLEVIEDSPLLGYKRPRKIPRRQSIISGNTDSNGLPTFLTASGLNVTIDATPTPLVLTFASGFNDAGAVDYIKEISADVANAWTLPATPAISGNVTRSSQTVTVNLASAHGMATGDYANLESSSGDYVGERPVTVSDSDTVTMTLAGTVTPTTPAAAPVFNRAFFLYVDYNVGTDTLSYGYVTTPPIYDVIYPAAPVTGQHYFSLTEWKMYYWNGSAWTAVLRIFIGDVWTSTASLTLHVWPLMGGYQGAGYNTSVNNADDTTSFGYSMQGGVVPSVSTSAKDKYVLVGPLREGQQVEIQINYLISSRNFSYSRLGWSNVNYGTDGIGGLYVQAVYAPIGRVILTFSGNGFLAGTWASLAAQGMHYRVRVMPLW